MLSNNETTARLICEGLKNLLKTKNLDRIRIKEITDEWKRIQAEYGEQAIAYTRGSGNLGCISGVASPMYNVFFNKINASMITTMISV